MNYYLHNIILDDIDTKTLLHRYEVCCMIHKPEWHQKQNAIKCLYPTGLKIKGWNPHDRYPNGTQKKTISNPTLLCTNRYQDAPLISLFSLFSLFNDPPKQTNQRVDHSLFLITHMS